MPNDYDAGVCPSCEQDIFDASRDYFDGDELACPLCSAELVVWIDAGQVTFEQTDREEC